MTRQLKKYINITKTYVAKIEKSGIPVTGAYIFGSRVKGTNHKWSDLDTCIVSPKFGRSRIKERVKLMTLGDSVYDLIEPHPFSPADFDDKYNVLATEIKRTGLRVI